MPSPVYVRGVGAVSNLGDSWSATVEALERGESGIGPIASFDTEGFPCRVAAELGGDESEARMALALPAARDAWRQAAVEVPAARVAVFIGAESGRVSYPTLLQLAACAGSGNSFDHSMFGRRARTLVDRFASSELSASSVASRLAREVGAFGPCETVSLACASGAAAIAEGVRAIRLGQCDAALCGGVGADVDPMMLGGFGLLDALSRKGTSCPFDVRRDGFVLGEGAAMVVLASEQGPARCAITGTGRSLDAFRLTAPDPKGDGACRAMIAALADSGRRAVDYVQAHGTSTPLNDTVEAQALRRCLGDALDDAHVSSVKGALGHWIAGAGALGALCAYHALTEGKVLPTVGLETPDPDCDVPHVMGAALEREVRSALVNAFAFGGANCSLVMEAMA